MSILQFNHVSLNFLGNNTPVLNDLTFQVQKGDFIILLGKNGSGKSTLLKLISRYYQPLFGEILFLNKPIKTFSTHQFSQKIILLSQNCHESLFTSLTLYENYILRKKIISSSSQQERDFLKTYLLEFNPNLCDKLDLPVQQLSGGEAQAYTLALCLLEPPDLLLLDENTSALDPKTAEQLMELTQRKIKQHHITCILTTHTLDIALRYGNRLLFFQDGKIHKVIDHEEKIKLTKMELMQYY